MDQSAASSKNQPSNHSARSSHKSPRSSLKPQTDNQKPHSSRLKDSSLSRHQAPIQEPSSQPLNKELSIKEWDTAYIDGKYYLSAPGALAKLRALDAQIEAEKEKLALVYGLEDANESFLSHQALGEKQGMDESHACLTEINASRLEIRKQKAEDDLADEEQRYRDKIEGMKRKRSIMKKEIGCGTEDNDKYIQASEHKIASEQKRESSNKNAKPSSKQPSQPKSKQPSQPKSKQTSQANSKQSSARVEFQKAEEIGKEDQASNRRSSASQLESRKEQNNVASPSAKPSAKKQVNVGEESSIKQSSRKESHQASVSRKSNEIKVSQHDSHHEIEESKKSQPVGNQRSQAVSARIEGSQQVIHATERKDNVSERKSVGKSSSVKQDTEKSKDKKSLQRSGIYSQKSAKVEQQKRSMRPSAKEIEASQKRSSHKESHKSRSSRPKDTESRIKQYEKVSMERSIKGQVQAAEVEVSQKPSLRPEVRETSEASRKQQKYGPTSQRSEKRSQRSEEVKAVSDRKSGKQSQNSGQKNLEEKSDKMRIQENRSEKKDKSQSIKEISKNEEPASAKSSIKNKSWVSQKEESQANQSIHDDQSSSVKPRSQKKQSEFKSIKQSAPSQKIHQNAFKKVDRSIQWQQPEAPEDQNSVANTTNIIVEGQPPSEAVPSSKNIQVPASERSAKLSSVKIEQKQSIKDFSHKSEHSKGFSKSIKSGRNEQEIGNNPQEKVQAKLEGGSQKPEQNLEQFHEAVAQIEKQSVKQNESQQASSRIKMDSSRASQKFKKSERISNSERGSESKKKSFVIHSRQSSIKGRKPHSRHSSVNKSNGIDYRNQSFSQKQELVDLNKKIEELQNKLQKVEEKQNDMIKFENKEARNMSQLDQSQMGSEAASPLGKFTLTSRLKLQNRLSLEGSTVQFNSHEEKIKETMEVNEKLQKLKLQEQIGRLKKIIRDMQLQKIMSIDHDPNLLTSSQVGEKQPSDLNLRSHISQKRNNSLNADLLETKRVGWQSQMGSKEEVGKIVKNSPNKSFLDSPRKFNRLNAEKAKQQSEFGREDDVEHEPLPLKRKAESTYSQKGRRDLTKSDLLERCDRNDKEFHQFLESSRLVHDPDSVLDQNNISMPEAIHQHHEAQGSFKQSRVERVPEPRQQEFSSMKRNFSEMVEKARNQNPEDEEIKCENIRISNIDFPKLPEGPNISMSQEELLELAKKTFLIFGIDIDQDRSQLCMKKYKNCVVFSVATIPDTILWHYSGKFYIGGWKNSEIGEGEKTGEGLEYMPGKHVYKGQFLGGKKSGNGIVKLYNENVYEGQWVDGVKSGRGVYFEASTGTYYSGEWKDGKRDGYGTLKFSSDEFYSGTFSKSVKHGYGVEKFANGDLYKGEYQKGKFHGKGRYVWANGSSYDGRFMQGFRHGEGSWKSSREGGDIYIGGYQNDKKCGYGRYVWANGCVYEGYFKADLKNGKGRLSYQDGREVKGIWENGNLVSNESERRSGEHEESPLRKSVKASTFRRANMPGSGF